jgi:lipid-binding SYLF domain-containing protein
MIGAPTGAGDEAIGRAKEASVTRRMRIQVRTALLVAAIVASASAPVAQAASRQELDRDGVKALQSLCASNTAAKLLNEKARAVLVFPSIVKAGFMFGGQIGDGVLLKHGRPAGYYNSLAASYGLQAGLQVFGYALFFMNDAALAYLDKSDGWELGVGPSIVVVDAGVGKSLTSTTLTQDVYAFIFDQKGLMAGIGIQGSKITKLAK